MSNLRRRVLGTILALAASLSAYAGTARAWTAAEVVSGELLVKFGPRSRSSSARSERAALGARLHAQVRNARGTARVLRDFSEIGWQRVQLPPGMTVAEGLKKYGALPEVTAAEPNARVRLEYAPNDSLYKNQTALPQTGMPEAWEVVTGSSSAVVAVVDTGVDYTHPDLAPNLWRNPGESGSGRETNGVDDDENGYVDDVFGADTLNLDGDVFDDYGHGTHVAGIIGAAGNNGRGISGVAWNTRIMSARALSRFGANSSSTIMAYEYIVAQKRAGVNVRVVNNSWSAGLYQQALYDIIAVAQTEGILSVCAAGNDQSNVDAGAMRRFPACLDLPSIVSVASCDSQDKQSSLTNWGKVNVDLAAPGVDILSCLPGDLYEVRSGTSMASPMVAGAAALFMASHPRWTVEQLKSAIMAATKPLPDWTDKCVTGGRLDLSRLRETVPRLTVTTLEDGDDGACDAGHCSLREAVQNANSLGHARIRFGVTGTITLTSALPALDCFVDIQGPAGGVSISGDGRFPLLQLAGGQLLLKDLTLHDGLAPRNYPGAGALTVNAGEANVQACTFAGNSGGESPVDTRNSKAPAGAVQVLGGNVQLLNCTLANNTGGHWTGTAEGTGAAGGAGAAAVADGTLTLTHCTLTGNTGGAGAQGTGAQGSGGAGAGWAAGGSLVVVNSLAIANTPGAGPGAVTTPFGGTWADEGNNVLDGVITLGTLGDNGGPTPTVQANDPRVTDQASTEVAQAHGLVLDQTGRLRPFGGKFDIGALENEYPLAPVARDVAVAGVAGTDLSLQLPISDENRDLLACELLSGVLPPGLALDSGGLLHGNALAASRAVLTYRVSDGVHLSNTATITFAIKERPGLAVTSLSDEGDEFDNLISLRDALTYAESKDGADTVTFAPGLQGQIVLKTVLPDLRSDISLVGPGASKLAITAAQGTSFRLLRMTNTFRGNVTGLTLYGVQTAGLGAAILTESPQLDLSDLILRDNSTTDGGAIFNFGTLTIKRCLFQNNSAGDQGAGGAIYSSGPTVLEACTFTGNSAGSGGAINTTGDISLTNCTLSGNRAHGSYYLTGGGAMVSTANGNAVLEFCTITGNTSASPYGGPDGLWISAGLSLKHCIVAGNGATPATAREIRKTSGVLTNAGFNLIGNNDGVETQFPAGLPGGNCWVGTPQHPLDAKLGPLQDNGGPTPTHALLAGSVARNAGDATLDGTGRLDQRGSGFPRVQGAAPDLGAVESVLNSAPQNVSVTPSGSTNLPRVARTFKATYMDEDGVADLAYVFLQIKGPNDSSPGLYAFYGVAANKLWLHDGTRWVGGTKPGVKRPIVVPQGSLNPGLVRVHRYAKSIRVEWSFCASPGFTGKKEVSLRALDKAGAEATLQDMGDWTVLVPPATAAAQGNGAPEPGPTPSERRS